MEYQGKPLNLELINDIVEIPSVQDVLHMEALLRYITNQFEKPYVLLLLTKGKDADEQAAIFDAIKEEYYREEILDAECIPNRYPNAISTDELQKIEFQLKYKHKAIEPDLGVLIQAYIYRQYPKSKIFKLKGDWYREGDVNSVVDAPRHVANWVTDYTVRASVGLVGEDYNENSEINRVLYDLRSKDWCSLQNTEDFLEILNPPIYQAAWLFGNYDFHHFYTNLFKDPWTTDPTTAYAQKRQSIIDELIAELQCPGNAKKAESQYGNREEVNKVFIELARQNSELQRENDALKSESANIEELKNRIKQLEDEKAERHELVAITETAKSKILAQIALFADLLHVPLCPPTNISAFSELVGKVSGWKADSVRSKINKNIDYSKAKAEIEEFAAIIDRISSDCKPIAEQMRNNVR